MIKPMRVCYLSPCRAAKDEVSLHICAYPGAYPSEPSLLFKPSVDVDEDSDQNLDLQSC